MKRAIIVGSSGQDGQLLFQSLEKKGCSVLGIARENTRSTGPNSFAKINILDAAQVAATVSEFQPNEIYYLAAFHHSSEEIPDASVLWQKSFESHVTGLLNFLEAIRKHSSPTRLFYAASSLVFGEAVTEPQNEETPLHPGCVYGLTKAAGMQNCRLYRRKHSVFAATGILYNHESHLRAEKFVSQKIIRAAFRIKKGLQEKLVLGDLSARIDWGYAPDFVEAMQAILAADAPDDFVVATGESHTVREFVEIVFSELALDWQKFVEEKPDLLARRKKNLRGDAKKLKTLTGWKPSVSFDEMVRRVLKQSAANV